MADTSQLLPGGTRFCDTARLLYAYWRAGGLAAAVTAQLVQTAVVAVAVAAAAFLLGGGVDYGELTARIARPFCPDGKRNAAALYMDDCYGHRPIDPGRVLRMPPALLAALAVVVGSWLVSTAVFVLWELPRLIRAHRLCRRKLKLGHGELQSIGWPELARQLLAHHHTPAGHVPPTEHDITLCITREDNYVIGLIAVGALRPQLWPGAPPFMPLSLFWNIEFAIDYAVGRPDEASRPMARRLRAVFRALAVANLALAPVILLSRLVHAVMWHGERVRQEPRRLSARQWSPVARWRFRRYGELPHEIEARLGRGHAPASQFAAGFRDRVVEVLARGLVAVAGGFVAVTVMLTAVFDEEYLGLELTPERSVAFWVTVAGGIATAAAAQLPNDDVAAVPPEQRLAELAAHIDCPPRWHADPNTPATWNEVVEAFPYKLTVLLDEVSAAVCIPWVLAAVLPSQAQQIASFYTDTMRLHGMTGHCCALALPNASETNVLHETIVLDPEEHNLKLSHYQTHHRAH